MRATTPGRTLTRPNICGRGAAAENLLNILARYVHLQIEERRWNGRKHEEGDDDFCVTSVAVVSRLIGAARDEGPGQKYLIHSAGSGKSN